MDKVEFFTVPKGEGVPFKYSYSSFREGTMFTFQCNESNVYLSQVVMLSLLISRYVVLFIQTLKSSMVCAMKLLFSLYKHTL